MSQAPAMPFYCDAYLADTMHLTLEQHGAYLKIIMVTWRNNGQPLPDDDKFIAKILGISVRRWRDKLKPVISKFFNMSEHSYKQKRVEKEWTTVAQLIAKRREYGARGGKSRARKYNNSPVPKANDLLEANGQAKPKQHPKQNPSIHNQYSPSSKEGGYTGNGSISTTAREVGADGLTAAPPSALPSKGNGKKPIPRGTPIGPDDSPNPRSYRDPFIDDPKEAVWKWKDIAWDAEHKGLDALLPDIRDHYLSELKRCGLDPPAPKVEPQLAGGPK